MNTRTVLFVVVLLKQQLFSDALLSDGECERYGVTENFSTQAYFTCIRDSSLVTLSTAKNCREIGPDWTHTDNRTGFFCAGNKYKIHDEGMWTSGDLLTGEQCTDPDNEKHIVAYRSECVLLTRQRYPWVNAVHACINISDVDQWQMIENISGDKQTFLEHFLHEEDSDDEVWIGLRYRWGGFKWNLAKGEVDFIPYVSRTGDGHPPPGPNGDCYATAGAGSDRVGGGWRGRPCSITLAVLCQTRGTPSLTTTELPETKSSITKTSWVRTKSTKPQITSTYTPPPRSPSRQSSTVRTEISTSTVKPTAVGVRTDLSSTVGIIPPACNTTKGTSNPKTANINWIYGLGALSITLIVISLVMLLYIGKLLRSGVHQLPARRVSYDIGHYDNPL